MVSMTYVQTFNECLRVCMLCMLRKPPIKKVVGSIKHVGGVRIPPPYILRYVRVKGNHLRMLTSLNKLPEQKKTKFLNLSRMNVKGCSDPTKRECEFACTSVCVIFFLSGYPEKLGECTGANCIK